MSDPIAVLVLGLGNVLCTDDGAGVAAVHLLRREHELPDGVIALDGGTLGLDLLPLVERADRVILLDAVRADGPPGTLVRLDGGDVAPAVRDRLSPHQIGVADLLGGAALLDRYPAEVVIVGVVPATIELGLGCSPAVAARVPALVEGALAELARMGYRAAPRTVAFEPDDDARALELGTRASHEAWG
jgi:hydrogenase maturation protease